MQASKNANLWNGDITMWTINWRYMASNDKDLCVSYIKQRLSVFFRIF